jgi:hypothetical protein
MNNTLIDQYCRIVNEGADFDHPRLQQLRERMTPDEFTFAAMKAFTEFLDELKRRSPPRRAETPSPPQMRHRLKENNRPKDGPAANAATGETKPSLNWLFDTIEALYPDARGRKGHTDTPEELRRYGRPEP